MIITRIVVAEVTEQKTTTRLLEHNDAAFLK
jgi:hypothetical protein